VTAKSLRDEKWATWTCPLGWPVRGIWPISSDGTEINTVDRSNDYVKVTRALKSEGNDKGNSNNKVTGGGNPSKGVSSSGGGSGADFKQYLVVGDDFGKIKIYNYPCAMDGGSNNSGANSSDHCSIMGSGHSAHVTNVKFSNDNKKIVSCGGSDRTVILWDVGVASDE
jgi:WD40 repeat protein